MPLIIKILFAALIFVIVGGITFISVINVNVMQETVTKEIPADSVIKWSP